MTAEAHPSPSSARLAAALLPAAIVPFLGSLIYFVAFSGQPWARWTYVGVKAFTLLWPLVAMVFVLRQRLPQPDWTSPRHRRALASGTLYGLAIFAAAALAYEAGLDAVIADFAPRIRHKVDQLGVLDHYLAFALFLSFLHSALEEYYWRWFLYGQLRPRWGVAGATIVASLAFASHHFVILSQYVSLPWAILGTTAVVAGGIGWCVLYQTQRSLAGAWVSHVFADLVILWVGWRLFF